MQLSRRQKISLIWAGAALVIGVGFAVLANVLYSPDLSPPPVPALPSVSQAPLRPTAFEVVRSEFGPWQLAPPASSGAPALVMLRTTGATDVSSWVVTPDTAWTRIEPSWLTAISTTEQGVHFRTNGGHTYAVAYDQPFILEQDLRRVFAVEHTAQGYEFLVTTTDHARQAGHKL